MQSGALLSWSSVLLSCFSTSFFFVSLLVLWVCVVFIFWLRVVHVTSLALGSGRVGKWTFFLLIGKPGERTAWKVHIILVAIDWIHLYFTCYRLLPLTGIVCKVVIQNNPSQKTFCPSLSLEFQTVNLYAIRNPTFWKFDFHSDFTYNGVHIADTNRKPSDFTYNGVHTTIGSLFSIPYLKPRNTKKNIKA